MKKISRKEFLKTSSLVAAVAAFNPPNLFGKLSIVTDSIDEWMLNRLVKANDQSVERFLQSISAPQRWQYYRNLSEAFSVFTAAFSHPESVYY
ncbi:MAG: hypothetical protein KDD63_00530, partial [Bacteroidetes bacterium]|nr:hypothetical protein [Bacteroidota bacterium]